MLHHILFNFHSVSFSFVLVYSKQNLTRPKPSSQFIANINQYMYRFWCDDTTPPQSFSQNIILRTKSLKMNKIPGPTFSPETFSPETKLKVTSISSNSEEYYNTTTTKVSNTNTPLNLSSIPRISSTVFVLVICLLFSLFTETDYPNTNLVSVPLLSLYYQ